MESRGHRQGIHRLHQPAHIERSNLTFDLPGLFVLDAARFIDGLPKEKQEAIQVICNTAGIPCRLGVEPLTCRRQLFAAVRLP
jgi:hypothetical protein